MSSNIPTAEALPHEPLADEHAILQRLATVIQGAYRRQAWFFVLDDQRAQLPVLIPIDLPPRPDGTAAEVFRRLLETVGEVGDVAAAIVVLERPGPAIVTDDDSNWLDAIEAAIRAVELPVHGPYFATDDGIRRWQPDEGGEGGAAGTRAWPGDTVEHAGALDGPPPRASGA